MRLSMVHICGASRQHWVGLLQQHSHDASAEHSGWKSKSSRCVQWSHTLSILVSAVTGCMPSMCGRFLRSGLR